MLDDWIKIALKLPSKYQIKNLERKPAEIDIHKEIVIWSKSYQMNGIAKTLHIIIPFVL